MFGNLSTAQVNILESGVLTAVGAAGSAVWQSWLGPLLMSQSPDFSHVQWGYVVVTAAMAGAPRLYDAFVKVLGGTVTTSSVPILPPEIPASSPTVNPSPAPSVGPASPR